MSGHIIIPDPRVNYLRERGWRLDAIYLEKLAKELNKPQLKLIAGDIHQMWWWLENPESFALAMNPENDASKPREIA